MFLRQVSKPDESDVERIMEEEAKHVRMREILNADLLNSPKPNLPVSQFDMDELRLADPENFDIDAFIEAELKKDAESNQKHLTHKMKKITRTCA
jgi:hypothetical protein